MTWETASTSHGCRDWQLRAALNVDLFLDRIYLFTFPLNSWSYLLGFLASFWFEPCNLVLSHIKTTRLVEPPGYRSD